MGDFNMNNLNFVDRDERKAFIQNTESGLYHGTDTEGRPVVVGVDQGKGMSVKYLNTKGWYEGYTYDANGGHEDEILERAAGPLCPKCKLNHLKLDKVMNALSRKDNKTYICNDCGDKEAFEEMGF